MWISDAVYTVFLAFVAFFSGSVLSTGEQKKMEIDGGCGVNILF